MHISVQMILVYRVADYNVLIFLFFAVLFYLAYCHDYHNSILSLFILIYCTIIIKYIFQIDFDTYIFRRDRYSVMYQLCSELNAASTYDPHIYLFNMTFYHLISHTC